MQIAYQNFERDCSGWTIDKIMKLEVNTVEYTPLEGSSYISLQPDIKKVCSGRYAPNITYRPSKTVNTLYALRE